MRNIKLQNPIRCSSPSALLATSAPRNQQTIPNPASNSATFHCSEGDALSPGTPEHTRRFYSHVEIILTVHSSTDCRGGGGGRGWRGILLNIAFYDSTEKKENKIKKRKRKKESRGVCPRSPLCSASGYQSHSGVAPDWPRSSAHSRSMSVPLANPNKGDLGTRGGRGCFLIFSFW